MPTHALFFSHSRTHIPFLGALRMVQVRSDSMSLCEGEFKPNAPHDRCYIHVQVCDLDVRVSLRTPFRICPNVNEHWHVPITLYSVIESNHFCRPRI